MLKVFTLGGAILSLVGVLSALFDNHKSTVNWEAVGFVLFSAGIDTLVVCTIISLIQRICG